MMPELLDRTKKFALGVMRLCDSLPPGAVGWNLAKQLMRSGTSVGANYREAQRARSKAEFASKVDISQQEAAETVYWLELVIEYGLVQGDTLQAARRLLGEAGELCLILSAISKSSRASPEKKPH